MSMHKVQNIELDRLTREDDDRFLWWQNFRRWFAFGSWASNWLNLAAGVVVVVFVITQL